jgi:galactokinase
MSSENALGFPSGLQDPMGSIGGELGGSERCPGVILIDSLPRERSGEPYVVTRTIPLTSVIRLLLVHTGVPKEPSAWKEFNVRADEAKLSSWLIAHWLAKRYPRFFSDPERVMNAYPDITKPESTVYPPFWRPFYFTGAELHRAGLSVSSSELAELVARLPKNTDRAQIVTMGMPHVVFDELTSGSRIAGEAMDVRFLNLKGSFCHVVTEQERVLRAIAAVERGDLLELGNLQKEIFNSLDLNYRVVSSAAKALVADVSKMHGVLAVRPLGGVWGCIAAVWLCEDVATDALMENIRTSFFDPRGLTRSEVLMMPTTPGTGAEVIFPTII